MALGIPAVLFNPSEYHRALSRRVEIPEIGVGKADMRLLARILSDPDQLAKALDGFELLRGDVNAKGLLEHLRGLGHGTGSSCPVCRFDENAAVERFAERTYYSCRRCGITYLESFCADEKKYDSAYFNKEYKRQYGKTYVEDFASIKKTGLSRVEAIRRLLGANAGGTVVDVGCAYGPFLEALKDRGFAPVGVDISADAVGFVREKIGVPAVLSGFEELRREMLPSGPIRAITLWYVIEHLRDLEGALKKACRFLSPEGVLAFSTPNGNGISARKSMRQFLENSPSDHFTVLSPRGLARFLRGYGFKLKIVKVTGHHPERFPAPFDRLGAHPFARKVFSAASAVFGLGDTFEAYAMKRKNR
jgi:2-polyprenyl-3-methyl-5-hydroxy-6-metoxy-1,4-benzoquinol methylase